MERIVRPTVPFIVFPLVYALSVLAGRATRLSDSEVSLIWPAAAVGIIWLLATWRRGRWERVAHIVALTVVAFATNFASGAALPLSAWFAMVNVVLSAVTVALLGSRRNDVALRDPADLARVTAAVAVGTCCAAILATLYFVVIMNAPVWATFGLFAVRNGATALLGVCIWLRVHDLRWTRPHFTPGEVIEALLVGGGAAFVYFWIFWLNTGLPTAFLALVPTMWLALRYSTTASTLFLTAAGVWIIYATLLDRGVFTVPDAQIRAVLAQAMVGSLTLIVLTLALYRDSRARLISELEQARDKAAEDSELLSAVLDSIHDSVILVDSDGDVLVQNARAAHSGLVRDVVLAPPANTVHAMPTDSCTSDFRDVIIGSADPRVIELTTAPLARQSLLRVIAFRDVTQDRRNAQELRETRDRFAGVLHAASEQAIIGTDPTGRITVLNNGAERLLGWTEAEVLGRTPLDFHLQSEVRVRAGELGIPAGFEVLVHNVARGVAEIREWTYVRRDGSEAAVSLAVSQMEDENGICEGYIGVATDITERKAAEQALAESEERFRLAFDTAPMGMLLFDIAPPRRGCVTRCNQAMSDFLGRSTSEVLRMTVGELSGHEYCAEQTAFDEILGLRAGEPFEAETTLRRADGAEVWAAISATVVAPAGSDPYGICLVEDITGRKRVEDELLHLASHDTLTGLANRTLLSERIESAIDVAGEANWVRIGLIFLDLDGFKEVNDTWGHAQGDEVLIEVATRIQGAISSSCTAARVGGDEFAVLCPSVPDPSLLENAAERIRAELRRPISLSVGEIYYGLSASVGVVISQGGCTAEALLQQADKLMYHDKRNGRGGVSVDLPTTQLNIRLFVECRIEIGSCVVPDGSGTDRSPRSGDLPEALWRYRR